jgi:hypothetical protein
MRRSTSGPSPKRRADVRDGQLELDLASLAGDTRASFIWPSPTALMAPRK